MAHDELFCENDLLFISGLLLVLWCEFLILEGPHRELCSILNQLLMLIWICVLDVPFVEVIFPRRLFINLIELLGSGIARERTLKVQDSLKGMITIGDALSTGQGGLALGW